MENSEIWQALLSYSKSERPHMSDEEHAGYANSYMRALIYAYCYGRHSKQWHEYYNEYLGKNPERYEESYKYANECIVKFVEKLTLDDLTIYDIVALKDESISLDEEMPNFLEIKLIELSEKHYQKEGRRSSATPAIDKIMSTKIR